MTPDPALVAGPDALGPRRTAPAGTLADLEAALSARRAAACRMLAALVLGDRGAGHGGRGAAAGAGDGPAGAGRAGGGRGGGGGDGRDDRAGGGDGGLGDGDDQGPHARQ
jgi:hypothetical protein